jgi:uncharacterized protein YbjT (DUF2867 family)
MTEKTVVLGGSGFIGRQVVRLLAKQPGMQVIVPTRDPDQAKLLKPMGAVGQIVPVTCRLSDDQQVLAALRGATQVVNLIGILFEPRKHDFAKLHGLWPGRLGLAAQAVGARRLVHVSALGAAADSPAAYARSKAQGEVALRQAMPAAVMLRPSVLFGADDNFLNQFAGLARWSPFLPLIGGGRTKFQPVFVEDVAAAIMAALNRPQAAGKIYELGGPQVLSFKEILEYIMATTGRRRLLLPVPWGLATAMARFLQLMPKPLLTVDQVKLLQTDNIVADGALGLTALGITPTPLATVASTFLSPRAA